MDKYILIANIGVFLCSLIGTIYGVKFFFRPKKALYLQMITCGIICIMYARMFQTIFLLSHGGLNDGFQVGLLGTMGSFMFFLSANYGQMDGLVDDGTSKFRMTRIKALLAPVIVLVMYVFYFLHVDGLRVQIPVGLVVIVMIPCVYYNFKHIIIYDVELGIIRQLRGYNILALEYAFVTMLEFWGLYSENIPLYMISAIGNGMVALVMLPVLKREAEKWAL